MPAKQNTMLRSEYFRYIKKFHEDISFFDWKKRNGYVHIEDYIRL